MKQPCRKACATCPFRKTVEPGALGGSPVPVYLGQTYAGFWIPCHEAVNYDDPNWRTDLKAPQCAGAAAFRANCEFPKAVTSIMRADPDPDVFGSVAAFIMHHEQCSGLEALKLATQFPPDMLAAVELSRASVNLVMN